MTITNDLSASVDMKALRIVAGPRAKREWVEALGGERRIHHSVGMPASSVSKSGGSMKRIYIHWRHAAASKEAGRGWEDTNVEWGTFSMRIHSMPMRAEWPGVHPTSCMGIIAIIPSVHLVSEPAIVWLTGAKDLAYKSADPLADMLNPAHGARRHRHVASGIIRWLDNIETKGGGLIESRRCVAAHRVVLNRFLAAVDGTNADA